MRRRRRGVVRRGLALLLAGVLAAPSGAFAAGDVQDQFYRHVEIKNKVLEPPTPELIPLR
jgi:hypothetical protein